MKTTDKKAASSDSKKSILDRYKQLGWETVNLKSAGERKNKSWNSYGKLNQENNLKK